MANFQSLLTMDIQTFSDFIFNYNTVIVPLRTMLPNLSLEKSINIESTYDNSKGLSKPKP